MSRGPKTWEVACPACATATFAVIPSDGEPLEHGDGGRNGGEPDDYEGKVWVRCRACDERFLVYYRTSV